MKGQFFFCNITVRVFSKLKFETVFIEVKHAKNFFFSIKNKKYYLAVLISFEREIPFYILSVKTPSLDILK